MELDAEHLENLQRIADSYVSISDLATRLHADYRDLANRFEQQTQQLEQINRQLAEALQTNSQLSAYLHTILDGLDAGVIVFTPDGVLSLFNQAAERLTGIPQNVARGRYYGELFPAEEHRPTLSLLAGTETKVKGEKWFGQQPVGYSASKIFDQDGTFLGVVEILYDIAGERKLRETIRQVSALAALGEMSAIIAHQVRNPLAGIVGFADLLQRDLPADHPAAMLAQKIYRGAIEVNRIINNLLDFTKKTKPEFRRLDLVKFLSEFVESRRAEAQACQIALSFETTTDHLEYEFDPLLFRQMMGNLLDNAFQALGSRGGTILVRLSIDEKQQVEIVVKDDGEGFSIADTERLFEPFFTTRANGTGLGLSVVKRVVDFHSGRIVAESPPEGGAVFRVNLPPQRG